MPALTAEELATLTNDVARLADQLYCEASDEVRALGHHWYFRAHDTAVELAKRYPHLTVDDTAAVIAVLSPRVRWEDNVTDADLVLQGRTSGFMAILSNVSKAIDIIARIRPTADVVSGPKVRRFWHNIRAPHTSHDVTLDVHMLRAIVPGHYYAHYGEPYNLFARKGVYDAVSEGVRQVADRHGVLAHQVQATIWIHERGSAD